MDQESDQSEIKQQESGQSPMERNETEQPKSDQLPKESNETVQQESDQSPIESYGMDSQASSDGPLMENYDTQPESEAERDRLPTEGNETEQQGNDQSPIESYGMDSQASSDGPLMENYDTQPESEEERDRLPIEGNETEQQENDQSPIESYGMDSQASSDGPLIENCYTQSESSPETSAENPKDGKWRFAYDVVKAVIHGSRGITISYSKRPPHKNFLFTDVHNDDVLDFLHMNGRYLKKLVGESTKETDEWNYHDDNYLLCKRKILEEYKPKNYTEKEFVRLCAGIAFIAIGNQDINELAVINSVVDELKSWMKEVLLPGGTLQDSTWAEN